MSSKFELCILTTCSDLISCAIRAGIDRVVVDLERCGKEERQGGRGLRVTDHEIGSITSIRSMFPDLHLVVRINPPGDCSVEEVEEVVENGATTIMLPYFRTLGQAADFLAAVKGRAKTCLLVETAEAVSILPELVRLPGLNEIHFGLNDLQISYGHRTLFEVFLNGTLERAAGTCGAVGIPYGFGGLAPLNWREYPVRSEFLVAENVRLKGARCLLGRAFVSLYQQDETGSLFHSAVQDLRAALARWRKADEAAFATHRIAFGAAVANA